MEKFVLTRKLFQQPDRLSGIAFHILSCLIQPFH